jgi:error-prone DNA polymerase
VSRAGVLTAAELAHVADGARARTAGIVIVRQRPGTAKGFVFVTVEDETGFANAIVTPQRFAAHRRTILALGSMIIEGVVQNRDGVVTLKADRFAPLPSAARPETGPGTGTGTEQASAADPNLAILSAIDVSHDFH